MRAIKLGAVDQSVTIRIVDSTDGTPETGVVAATSGLALYYRRQGAARVSISLSNLSALTDAHSDGGLLHIGDGYYRLDVPDLGFAAGSADVVIEGTATGMVVIGAYHPLVAYDPADAMRLGLTALPNAAAGGSGGVPLGDASGRVDLTTDALDADALKGDAVTEIQSGLGTAANQTTINDNVLTRLPTSSYTAPDNAGIAAAAASASSADGKGTTILARLGAFTGSGLNTVLGFFRALGRKDASITPSDMGGTFDSEDDSLQALRDELAAAIDAQLSGVHGSGLWGSSGGSGQYTITVTVRNAATLAAIPDAQVTMRASDNTTIHDQKRTNSLGVAVFTMDAGTYYRMVSVNGYSAYSAESFVVSANAAFNLDLTAIPPGAVTDPPSCTASIVTYNNSLVAVSGITLSFQLLSLPEDDESRAFDSDLFTKVSDANGLVTATLRRGATYQAKRGNGPWIDFVVPDAATYVLPSILGYE